jgi:hypothetical protein
MSRLFRPSRRALLRGSLAGLAALGLPAQLGAAPVANRRFLFVYVNGGWDPTFVFAPLFGSSQVDMPSNSRLATVSGIPLVDSTDRPFTRTFFQDWGASTCVINGMEVPSITHDRCRRILLTGGATGVADDWPSTVAAETGGGLRLPCVVASGPAYTSDYSAAVVRLGPSGQLSKLLDGSALTEADHPIAPPPDTVQAIVDARLATRLDSLAADGGAVGDFAAAQLAVQENRQVVAEGLADLELEDSGGPLTPLSQRAAALLTCFENDLSRCAVIEHAGLFARRWDNHSDIDAQTGHYEDLFESLSALMIDLDTRSGPGGGSLLDETTIVVFSEMGRTPLLNPGGGKDHWTWTSALVIGAGVAGGRVVGSYDDGLVGQAIDLANGEADASGTIVTAGHLGSTILAMAGLDPESYRPGVLPIAAVIG